MQSTCLAWLTCRLQISPCTQQLFGCQCIDVDYVSILWPLYDSEAIAESMNYVAGSVVCISGFQLKGLEQETEVVTMCQYIFFDSGTLWWSVTP